MITKRIIKYIKGFIYWKFHSIRYKTKIKNYNVSTKSEIGSYVSIHRKTYIYGKISIGSYSYISGPNTILKDVKIGKFCSIARNVVIAPGNHEMKFITTHPFLYSTRYKFINKNHIIKEGKAVQIGNDVWIGINAVILDNVNIGDGAVIAAGAVVTHNVEPYAIVGGVPAKNIGYRFSAREIKELRNIEWWNWSKDEIARKIESFYSIEAFFKNI